MKDYRTLEVWQTGHSLALGIYRVTKTFPKDELFCLVSQMRRAASSIPANIDEGCGRDGDPELKRFVNIALGSACELDYFILLAANSATLSLSKPQHSRQPASACAANEAPSFAN